MKSKKKPNIVLYTIFMAIVFFVLTELVIWEYGSNFIINAITNYPKGEFVIRETVLASLALIVMLLFKNSYVFTQKREKLTKGLFMGIYYIIGAIIFIIILGALLGGFKGGISVVNLMIGCFFIGITEEFLCRGWLLNEFLERFGDSKKGVWYSIIISGFIFGLLHLTNIYNIGQDVVTTISQVLSATGTGIVFGLIYYKTKNIWSVIILHGLWDFSTFLSSIMPVTSINETIISISIISFILSLLMFWAVLLNIIPYVKNIDGEPEKSSIVGYAVFAIVLFMVLNLFNTTVTRSYGETYNFDKINIKNYAVVRDNYEDYYIKRTEVNNLGNSNIVASENNISNGNIITSRENYSFKLSKNSNNNLVFTNLNTNNSVEIKCNSLGDYIIMEKEDYYILAYVDRNKSSNVFLNYIYIKNSELSNGNSFVDTIQEKAKKYLLNIQSESFELLTIGDRENDTSYLAAYSSNYGYYLLTSENKMSILDRN